MSPTGEHVVERGSPESTQAYLDAQCNSDYYHSHMKEIWDEHDGQIVFVYDGGTVESFNRLEDFANWLEQLPDTSRRSGLSFHREAASAWIL